MVFGAVLVVGLAASAVLAFVDEPPIALRLVAVLLVAAGALVPVGRQLKAELTPSQWELYVSYRRREPMFPKTDAPWQLFGISPGDTIFKVRDIMDGDEDEIVKSYRGPAGSDVRVWRRPGFTLDATVYRDEVYSMTAKITEGQGPSAKVAVPPLSANGPAMVLGSTRLSNVDRKVGAPSESPLHSAEDIEWIELRSATGPEGSLEKTYGIWRNISEGHRLAEVPLTTCTVEYGHIERTNGNFSWSGWPDLQASAS